MATLKDVAALAHVDVSTVSRALNNKAYVHPETKRRILKAVKQLGYAPNLVAKSLRQGKRHTIGVVVPSINISIFGEIVQGMEEQARNLGYSILISNTMDDPQIERECLARMRTGLVDGIVIASTGENMRLLADIASENIAIIQIVRNQSPQFDCVAADYYECGYEATQYLVKLGCRHIGLINGHGHIRPYEERYQGYKKALAKAHLQEYVVAASKDGSQYFEDGYQATKELLKMVPSLDAIMVATDLQALGVIRAVKKAGLSVPEDVRIISLTGHPVGATLETAMTSMQVPSREMGECATKLMIERIESEDHSAIRHQQIVFQTMLMTRETT
ncbi:LacI family DNA-binding transcriptional regulator [Lacticaseibacillus baoqingensis]|uniref:LacI family DNA-binding transcriptional regulator n=1 Tax=Lacticaseibacillus baoqingensis TaxID=2486013 RepID=A0ABW4E594_9LACO|nr:LacI family DNA-binding transcriptional regulator [Lacticaseibacillus baoqingensis]